MKEKLLNIIKNKYFKYILSIILSIVILSYCVFNQYYTTDYRYLTNKKNMLLKDKNFIVNNINDLLVEYAKEENININDNTKQKISYCINEKFFNQIDLIIEKSKTYKKYVKKIELEKYYSKNLTIIGENASQECFYQYMFEIIGDNIDNIFDY